MAEDKGSASIANSRIHSRGVSAGFMPIFQTLNSWEHEAHSRLFSAAGIALEAVQFTAFAICPYFLYRAAVVDELVQVVFATTGPLWYRPFGPFAYTSYVVPFVIAFAAVFGTLLLFTLLCLKKIESTNIFVTNSVRHFSECIAGWLFLPILHLFLGGMNCGSSSTLINFPEYACWDGLHSAMVAIGVLGVVGTFVIGFVVSTSLSDTNPQSSRLRARSHNYVEAVLVVMKLALVIFFHILVERNAFGSYHIMVVVSSIALLILHAVILPFYRSEMTTIRCATFAVTAFVGIINCITTYSGNWFFLFDINSFLVAALLPFAAYLGVVVAELRPSSELKFKIESLLQFASVPRHRARFPYLRGVMSNDTRMCSIRFKTLESDIIHEHASANESSQGTGPTWEEIVVACSEILVPYIDNVGRATDAEVAVRFIQEHQNVTNLTPSANSLAFATRIFLKSIVLYKRSGIARFHFANFLYVYANRLNLSLELLNEIDLQVQDEHDALVLYSSYKVGVRVKELFGVRDNTHLITFQRARQFHKEALGDMAMFWAKLMESKGDIVGLAILTNQLTERRQNAREEYERALMNQKGDRLLLSTFASFLEQVMCDDQGAEVYRQLAEEAAEEKKNRIMRGSRAKNDIGTGNASHVRVALEEPDDDEEGTQQFGASSLIRMLVVFLFLVVLCAAGIFIMQQVRLSQSSQRLDALSSIGSTRSHAQESIFHSIIANNARNSAGCTNSTCTDATFRLALYNLSQAEVAMRVSHNLATYGTRSTARTTSAMAYVASPTMSSMYNQVGSLWLNSIFAYFTKKASSTVLTLFMVSNALDEYVEPWMNVHDLSMHVTRLVNSMYSGVDFSRSFLYLTSDEAGRSLDSLLIFSDHHVTDVRNMSNGILAGLAIVFALSIALVGAAYLTFFVNLEAVGHNKATILKLFTLIPYPTQELLQNAASNRIEQFEKLNAEDQKDVGGNADHEDDLGDALEDEAEMHHNRSRRDSGHSAQKIVTGRGLDDDVRRMSRFFGTARSTSQSAQQFFPSILKNSMKAKAKKKKHVQFTIEGEIHTTTKKLREPKVKLDTKPKDLVIELERSMKDIERQSAQETQMEKQRKDQETEKMIYGGLRSQQATMKRTPQAVLHEDTVEELKVFGELVLRPLVAFLSVATLVLMILVVSKESDMVTAAADGVNKASQMQSFLEDYQRAELAASHFSNFGRAEHYVSFFDYVASKQGYWSAYNNLIRGFNPADRSFIVEVTHVTQAAEQSLNNLIGVMSSAARALVPLGNIASLSDVPLLATFVTNDRKLTPDFATRYPRLLLSPTEYVFSGTVNTSKAPSVTPSILLNVALFRLNSGKLNDDRRAFEVLLNSSAEVIRQDTITSMSNILTAQQSLVGASIALAAVAAAMCLLKLYVLVAGLRSHESVWSTVAFDVVVFSVLFCLCIVVVATSIATQTHVNDILSGVSQRWDTWTMSIGVRQDFFNRQRFAVLRYVCVGDDLTLYEIGLNYTTSSISASYTQLQQALTKVGLENAATTVSSLLTGDLYLWQIQQVGMWLYKAYSQASLGQAVSPPSPPFLAQYDFSQELGSAADAVLYSSDSKYQYSTPAVDATRSASDLFIMARQAVMGLRAHTRFFAVYDSFNTDIEDVLLRDITSGTNYASSVVTSVANAAIAFSAIALVLATFAAVRPFLGVLTEAIKASKMAKLMMDSLFAGTLRKCQAALLLLVAVLIAQFIVAVVTVNMGEQAAKIIETARSRETLIMQSVTLALKANASAAVSDSFEMTQMIASATTVRSQLNNARNVLYFASTATSTAFGVVSSLSSTQRSLTFDGGARSLDSQYLMWLANLDSLAAATIALVTSPNPNNTLANLYLLSPSTIAQVASTTAAMVQSSFGILLTLRASNDQYDADMKAALQRSLIPDVILFAAVIVVVVAQLYFIFFPVTQQLEDEEKGTRLMLNMIPQVVREAVPKISTYLETGVLIQEEDERKVYERCPKAAEFLALWQHSDDQHACFAVLDQSVMCQILIDVRGIVQFANRHTPEILGYTDLEGRNISCLLDEPLRSLHDNFLRRFVHQGTSRVVGTSRDVVATMKNGEHTHLYLHLDEAVAYDGATFFIGGLEKYAVDEVKSGIKRMEAKSSSSNNSPQRQSQGT